MSEEEKPTKQDLENLIGEFGLKYYYEKIIKILREYMDLEEEYYSLIAIWIIGTYLHKQFPAYPYLFFNAMKGSGKSRILKIISHLSFNGKMLGSMTEAVLFRTAKNRTLCIDEIERANAKGNENLGLLLNSAYKRGLTIERMAKKKTIEGESQIVESFEVYCPITMANIWGMENTLADRCITIILEKSSKSRITKLIEDFENNIEFQTIRGGLKRITEKLGEINLFGEIFRKWNYYQEYVVNNVSIVSIVSDVNNVSQNLQHYDIYDFTTLFQHINETKLQGRDLELFFPMYILADMVSQETLKEVLQTSKNIIKEKKESDREENRDVRLIEFLAERGVGDLKYYNYIEVEIVVKDFQDFLGVNEKWINSRGISRALKRLGLILDRRSTGKARQVKLNISKAQEKLLMFKEEPSQQFTDSQIKDCGWTKEEIQEALK